MWGTGGQRPDGLLPAGKPIDAPREVWSCFRPKRLKRPPWIAVTIAITLATGGCCYPRLVTISGTLPKAENESGILRHDDWKYYGEEFSISVGTSDWERNETGRSERPRIEGPKSRMVRFTISAGSKSAVRFDSCLMMND